MDNKIERADIIRRLFTTFGDSDKRAVLLELGRSSEGKTTEQLYRIVKNESPFYSSDPNDWSLKKVQPLINLGLVEIRVRGLFLTLAGTKALNLMTNTVAAITDLIEEQAAYAILKGKNREELEDMKTGLQRQIEMIDKFLESNATVTVIR